MKPQKIESRFSNAERLAAITAATVIGIGGLILAENGVPGLEIPSDEVAPIDVDDLDMSLRLWEPTE